MTQPRDDADGFVAFYREYTRTWYHALATAALTAFGTLTVVDRLFAVLAVAAYVLPPLLLYLRGSVTSASETGADAGRQPSDRSTRSTSAGSPSDETAGDAPPRSASESGAGRTAGGNAGTPANEGWRVADVPTDETLHDAVVTGHGAYAVDGGGAVFTDGRDGWRPVVSDGPGASANALNGIAAAGSGGVWFAGDGGAVGRLDPSTGRHVDYSAPTGDTTTIADIAAVETSGTEIVLLADGSGRVRRGRYHEGETRWTEPTVPGSGSSVAGVALLDESTGYLCDTNQSVFQVRDSGAAFDRIGLDSADGTLTDVAPAGAGGCLVGADDGVVHEYDGARWTPARLGDGALWAVAVDDGRMLAVGDAGGVYERSPGATRWERATVPTSVPLRGASIGGSRAVAVGEDGALVERSPRGPVGDGR